MHWKGLLSEWPAICCFRLFLRVKVFIQITQWKDFSDFWKGFDISTEEGPNAAATTAWWNIPCAAFLQLIFSMQCQIFFPNKVHSTGIFVRFFACVYQDRFFHVILSPEAKVTMRIFVWFFTSVDHVVSFQVTHTFKSSTTNVASVYFSQFITFRNGRHWNVVQT